MVSTFALGVSSVRSNRTAPNNKSVILVEEVLYNIIIFYKMSQLEFVSLYYIANFIHFYFFTLLILIEIFNVWVFGLLKYPMFSKEILNIRF